MQLAYQAKKSEELILAHADAAAARLEPLCPVDNGLLIHGESFAAISLLRTSHAGKIDLIYIDPPFNTRSRFYYSPQRTAHVSHASSASLAYSDNMGFEDYLEFMRERFFLLRQLLSDSGTLYLHIDAHAGHYLKILLDEIFGRENFVNEIARIKANPKNFKRRAYGCQKDTLYVYSRKPGENIFNDIRLQAGARELARKFPRVDAMGRRYATVPCHAPGETKKGATGEKWNGVAPPPGRHWRYAPQVLAAMDHRGLIEWSANNVPRIRKYADDYSGAKLQDVWRNYKDPQYPVYPTEKNGDMLEMIVLQSSHADSTILDCFCGSGAFPAAGRRCGRKVIGIDLSSTAIGVARQRPELAALPVVEI